MNLEKEVARSVAIKMYGHMHERGRRESAVEREKREREMQ